MTAISFLIFVLIIFVVFDGKLSDCDGKYYIGQLQYCIGFNAGVPKLFEKQAAFHFFCA